MTEPPVHDSVARFIDRRDIAHAFSDRADFEAVAELLGTALHDGIFIRNHEGRVVYINWKVEDIIRIEREELIGSMPLDARWRVVELSGDEFPPERHPAPRVLETGEPVLGEIMGVERHDGSVVWLNLDTYPLDLRSGRHTVAILTDITDRIVHTRAIRATEGQIQRQLLQHEFPHSERVRFASAYRSAGVSRSIGGDFLGAYRHRDDEFGCFIGDVCGHGIEAATLSSLARSTVRAIGPLVGGPGEVLDRLHAVVRADWPDLYLTALYAELTFHGDRPLLRIGCGGHPLPVLVRDGSVSTIGEPGLLVGMVPNQPRPVVDVELRPGDHVLFYTDGVLDGASPRLGVDELIACLPADVNLEGAIEWMMALGRTSDVDVDDAAVIGFEIS